MLSPRSRSRKNLARPQSKPARYSLHNLGWVNTSTDLLLSSANGNVFSEAVWVQTGRNLFLSGSWAPPTLSNKWPHIWGAHLHLQKSHLLGSRHLEAGRCWQDWTMDAECSVIRNWSLQSLQRRVTLSEQLTWAEWGSEERSRGKKDLRAGVKRPDFKYTNC